MLKTTKEVIEALGGYQKVAELTGRGYSAVANWAHWDHFPCATYLVIVNELAKSERVASPSLWKMIGK